MTRQLSMIALLLAALPTPFAIAQSYSAKVSESYNFHFGPQKPFAPGNASLDEGKFLQPAAFPSAKYCAHCHPQAFEEWRQALHSNSFRTPFYRTSVNIMARTQGISFTRHCDSCHNPIGVLAGGLTEHSQVDRRFDEDGLTCTTCHSIARVKSTEGNGGYVMAVPSVIVDGNGKRIPGEVPFDQIMKYPKRHAQAVMQDFYRSPEFCAACHKANLPATLNDYKFIRAFTTFDEWQNSKFSGRNPLTFYKGPFMTCQTCHMMRAPAAAGEYGAKHGTFASHRWLAGNTAVPFYYNFDKQLKKTTEFLQSGMYLNLDLFGLKRNNGPTIAPLGAQPYTIAAGDTLQLMIVVQNRNIGHSLIPEVRDLYEAWLELDVSASDGRHIYQSGFIGSDGMLDRRAHSFTNRPVNVNGDFVDNHKVWTIHSVAYDNTIQAGRSVLVRYEFRVPPDVKGALTVTARVNYRHLRQSYLNNVFGMDHAAYPVVELAARTRFLKIGDNPTEIADPRDNPIWMRWNNLGIAYLDQLQYAEAIAAFEQVIAAKPLDAAGYVNVGLTNIQWEKYESARANLTKALSIDPDDPRALYYMALVERRQGYRGAELTDLLKVEQMYPESRDVHRELGTTYRQLSRIEDARSEFEKLQAIDPDDVSAHYNLAIVYSRLGMANKASEQAALFATKKVDPDAPTYSLDYLRNHPEISTESVPWHVHTDLPASSGHDIVSVANASGNRKLPVAQ